ncbi:MAG: zinc-binding dehydrogenase [Spirochaetota bacterium]
MKRKVYKTKGGRSLQDLHIVVEELAKPLDNAVSVKVEAIGLNYADVFAVTGLYSATPKGAFTPGLEFAGTIVELGKNVKGFSKGQKVMGVTRFGAYTSHLNVQQDYIYPLPESWSFAEGAAFVVQGLTAFYALVELGNLQKGQSVLVHSAAGGVGILAQRIAKKYGAYTIASIGSENKINTVRAEGYDAYIVRSERFYQDLLICLENRELHLVLECIGGKIFMESYRALAPTGRLVTYGFADFTPMNHRPGIFSTVWKFLTRPRVDPLNLVSANKSVMGFNLIWLYDRPQLLKPILTKLMSLELPPQIVGKTYPFSEAIAALTEFKAGKTVGKLVLHSSES